MLYCRTRTETESTKVKEKSVPDVRHKIIISYLTMRSSDRGKPRSHNPPCLNHYLWKFPITTLTSPFQF